MRLKLFSLSALLIAFSFSIKAQSLSLDQTVDYINELFRTKNASYRSQYLIFESVRGIQVEKSGRIIFFQSYDETAKTFLHEISSFSVFDLESAEWEDDKTLSLKAKNNIKIGSFVIDQPDGNRLYKAIWHLKEVCTKSADPFGN